MRKPDGKHVNSYYYPKGRPDYLGPSVSDDEKVRIVDAVALASANGTKLLDAVTDNGITVNTYYNWKRSLEKRRQDA